MGVVRNIQELTQVLEELHSISGTLTDVQLTSEGSSEDGIATASGTLEFPVAAAVGIDADRLSFSTPSGQSSEDGHLRIELDIELTPAAETTVDASTDRDADTTGSANTAQVHTDGGGVGVHPPGVRQTPPLEAAESPSASSTDATSVDDAVEAGTATNTASETSVDTSTESAASSNSGGSADATGVSTADTEDTGTDTDGAEDVPAHRDPAQLQAVYDEHKTFKEMTDALGVDVTPQTVRNQMIQHGIHQPNSYGETSSSESDEPSPSDSQGDATDMESQSDVRSVGVSEKPDTTSATRDAEREDKADRDTESEDKADTEGEDEIDTETKEKTDTVTETTAGSDATERETDEATETQPESTTASLPPLPEEFAHLELTTTEVCDAVEGAKTLYEVERTLGLDREPVRDLLSTLDLLELVTGRMVRRDQPSAAEPEIHERVHTALDA